MLPYWRLSAFYFCYFSFLGAFAPYFSLYLKYLGMNAWQIGVLMSLMQVMRLVASNVWGALADRFGLRMELVRGASLTAALCFSGFLVAKDFFSLFMVMALVAFFWAASLPLMEAVTLEHLAHNPAGYGRIRLWGSVGFIVLVLVCGTVLDHQPVSLLIPLTLGILMSLAVSVFLVPDGGGAHHGPVATRLREILLRREVLGLLAACFAMAAAHAAYYIFFSVWLVEHAYSKSAVGWLWSLGVIVEIGVFIAMPRLLSRFSARAILSFSMACAVMRFLLIAYWVDSWPAILFAQSLHGATFGANHAAAMAAIGKVFPGRHQARGQAVYSSVTFGAGGMVGGLLAGWCWDHFGGVSVWLLSALFAALGLTLMLRARPIGLDSNDRIEPRNLS